MSRRKPSIIRWLVLPYLFLSVSLRVFGGGLSLDIKQISFGPKNHLFGYIGHVQNIPWNQSGRYILAFQRDDQERMPNPGEAANIVLIDTQKDYAIKVVDQTRAWNPQQGTMFYWNPDSPETQFFFNDSDAETKKIFTVLYDVSKGKRVREYRYDDTPFGNGGVAQKGGYFLGINYGRMTTLRPVTGYPGVFDWTGGEKHPENDGVFKVNIATGEKQLLVSFKTLADLLRPEHPSVDTAALQNHYHWQPNLDGGKS